MLKKIFIFFFLMFILSSCNQSKVQKNALEGYWMDEHGSTVSFVTDTLAIVGNVSVEYHTYGDNFMTILYPYEAVEYKYEIQADVLKLIDQRDNTLYTFYGDEKTQIEIKKRIEQWSKEQAEYEQEQLEYQTYVETLKTALSSIRNEILNLQKDVEYNNGWILDAETWIQDELVFIEEIDAEIADLRYAGNDERILQLEENRELHCDNMERYKADIHEKKTEIELYIEKIQELSSQENAIVEELNNLGEY